MSERAELLAAVAGRLEHVRATQDLSVVLEPHALAEAMRLTVLVDDQDVPARHMLGWLHLYRALAGRPGRRRPCRCSHHVTPSFILGSPPARAACASAGR